MRAPAKAARLADALVLAAFAVVPLLATQALWDQFVSVKWYALQGLAAAWLLVEVLLCASGGWPEFVRSNRAAAALLALLGLASTLRAGPGAGNLLAERAAAVALCLCAYWALRRGDGALRAARTGSAVALAAATGIGLAQWLGADPLRALGASDGRGSTFGNANMAAQYAGLALLLLASGLPRARAWRAGQLAAMAAAGLWIVVLGSRSVLLATGAGAAAAWMAGRPGPRARALMALAAAAAVVAGGWWASNRLLGPDLRARKDRSPEHRLTVWADTLRLVGDSPLGLGAGRFEDAFRAYQAVGASAPDENQVYRHPHNELLRLAAEEGLAFVAVLAFLVARLLAALIRAGRARPPDRARVLLAGWGAFLLVESLFQFPLALAFGTLAAASWLGLAWREVDGGQAAAPAAGPRWAWAAAAVVAAAAITAGLLRTATAERLFVAARTDLAAQERACRLDPRNLPACVMAAWLRGTAGDLSGGRAAVGRVLERAPHYPPALKLAAQQALAAGDTPEACRHLRAHDHLFRGTGSLHGDLLRHCGRAAGAGPTGSD